METLLLLIEKLFLNIGPFFILLGILIFVHEFGHFAVAKYFGVRVEVFCLGFGKKLFQKKRGDTTYAIALIPLGGYVKMYGDDPTKEIPEEEQQYSFLHKPVSQRIAVVFAGPFINFLFAIIVFALIGMIGEDLPSNQLGDIQPNTIAHSKGFRSGDFVNKINDKKISNWSQAQEIIKKSANSKLNFEVERQGQSSNISVTPELVENDNILSTMNKIGKVDGLSILSQSSLVGVPDPNSFFGKLNLKNLSFIEKIGDKKIKYYRDLLPTLQKATPPFELTYTAYTKDGSAKAQTTQVSHLPEKMDHLSDLGIIQPDLFLAGVKEDSPAHQAGLRLGDQIISVNNRSLNKWEDLLASVKAFKAEDKILNFTILREGKIHQFDITPKMTELLNQKGQNEKRFTVGIMPAIIQLYNKPVVSRTLNPFKALWMGLERSIKWTKLTLVSFLKLAQGKVSAKNISGVITIGRVASQSFEAGISSFLKMMAIISINLFLLNLMPIPVLDGGHLLFYTLEIIGGGPISMKKMEVAQTIGIVLLLSLMTFALFNDVANWFASRGW